MVEDIVIKNDMNFKELEKMIYMLVCQIGCSLLKAILENKDQELMKNRDRKEYRHKGYRKNTIKTLMGEVEYSRAIYNVQKGKNTTSVFLLDNTVKIDTIGKISTNLAEKMLQTVSNMPSYRKASKEIQTLTKETISHEALKDLVWKIGKQIENKEKQEVRLLKQEKLYKGTNEIPILWEEADGLWVHLQGKDRKEQIEKYKKECEKKNKQYVSLRNTNTELKLHVMYEGWKKEDNRHPLINKSYISGIMSSKEIEKIRNAKVYQKYNEEKIELRVMNGDGASWINKIAKAGTICQKDLFHIQQEIIRDIKEKEYQENVIELIRQKKYNEIPNYIESLKYKCGGEEKTVKKLEKLKSYLKTGLPRYTDILKEQNKEMPLAPEGIEYRTMGTMESQIHSVLKMRLSVGRKAWSKKGATYISKICSLYVEKEGNIEIETIKEEVKIDNSIEEWIKEIEEVVNQNKKTHKAKEKIENINRYVQGAIIEYSPELKKLLSLAEPTALMYR